MGYMRGFKFSYKNFIFLFESDDKFFLTKKFFFSKFSSSSLPILLPLPIRQHQQWPNSDDQGRIQPHQSQSNISRILIPRLISLSSNNKVGISCYFRGRTSGLSGHHGCGGHHVGFGGGGGCISAGYQQEKA